MPNLKEQAESLEKIWNSDPRWEGVRRDYSAFDVLKLRGSLTPKHTLAEEGAKKFWRYLKETDGVFALGAITGNQAVQQATAGLRGIYVSGWQVAADNNGSFETYPDQSLYPSNSVPELVKRINRAFMRADQIQFSETLGKGGTDFFVPVIADAEAGFGGNLNAFEIMKWMIEAGAAGVHFEDQLSSAKKCGHMGGKVLVPTLEAVQKLQAARLASDVLDVPTAVIARTDANGAHLITSDIDERDRAFLTGDRTVEGFFTLRGGIDSAIARGIAYAPYADLIWCETSEPNLEEAKKFAEAVLKVHPKKILAYNCSPSFNWKKKLDEQTIANFRKELCAMGYKFHFITLAGFHSLNYGMFELASAYRETAMSAYANFQAVEFEAEKRGYKATTHQKFVGTGYFDDVAQVIAGGKLSTQALVGSTEEEQFNH